MSFTNWDATKRAKSDELCRRGKFRHLLLPHQKAFYDMVQNGGPGQYGLYSSRKVGKSFTLFVMALEYAWNKPGTIQRIVLPEKTQAKEIFQNIHNELKSVVPSDMLPRYLKMEASFIFTNGSRIVLGGSLPDNIESNRGPLAHRILRDEVAAWNVPTYDYATYSVLLPQGSTVPDFQLIDATTPPKSPSHPWIQNDYKKLIAKGRLKTFNIYDNSLLTPEMIERIIEQYGGETNPNFRREHLCELVADSTLRLVPEFDKDEHVGELPPLTDNFGNREMFRTIVSVDAGLNDNTAMIFGYHDHIRDKFVVRGTWIANYKSFDVIVQAYNDGVKQYLTAPAFLPPDNILDIFEIARHTLNVDYGWITTAPSKARLEETIAFLRDCFKTGRIIIAPECKELIFELENGVWKDNRKDIDRVGDLGHCDAIMGLAYGVRAVNWGRSPTDSVPLRFSKISGNKK